MAATKSKAGTSQYWIILSGVILFFIGLVLDFKMHGMEFLMEEIEHAPAVHLLPLAGMGIIVIGLFSGWKNSR